MMLCGPAWWSAEFAGTKSSAIVAAAKSGVVDEAVHVGHSASLHSHGGPLLQRVEDLNKVTVIPLINRSAGFSSVGQ